MQKCLEVKQQVAHVLQLFAFVLIVPRRPTVLVSEAPEDVHVSCLENSVAGFVKILSVLEDRRDLGFQGNIYLDHLIYQTLHILGVSQCMMKKQ